MKIVIRTDSSAKIGTGHLMRCLTLADGLAQKGAEVHFICRELEGHLSRFVSEKGYALHLLPAPTEEWVPQKDDPDHAAWLEVSWQRDLAEFLAAIEGLSSVIDWLVVDHYALDHRWEAGLGKAAKKVLAIDDLADRAHDCELLLDQNYFGENDQRYDGLVPKGCGKLLGPRYALLRPEFRRARAFTKMRGNGVARVLVYFGGNDPDNLSQIALESLGKDGLRYLFADIVVGPNYRYLDDLKRLAEKRGRSRLHVQPESFVELMLRADLCIGAGGTTTWERLCLGLPSIVITVASNQSPFTRALDKAGFIRYLGPREKVWGSDITAAVQAETENSAIQGQLIRRELVDGLGMNRVRDMIGEMTYRHPD